MRVYETKDERIYANIKIRKLAKLLAREYYISGEKKFEDLPISIQKQYLAEAKEIAHSDIIRISRRCK